MATDNEQFDGQSASTQYMDWSGTISLDEDSPAAALAERSGLNRDQWWILGVRFFREYEFGHLSFLAVPRSDAPTFESLQELASENDGAISVTEFEVTDPGGVAASELIFGAMKRASIHLVSHGAIVAPGNHLVVNERTALPGPEDELSIISVRRADVTAVEALVDPQHPRLARAVVYLLQGERLQLGTNELENIEAKALAVGLRPADSSSGRARWERNPNLSEQPSDVEKSVPGDGVQTEIEQ